MTQEIIYTSAPSGLKPGSRGFCTVVATRGLAKPLADQLEDLSGYRHIFVSNDANSALNPIVFSHLKLSIAGRTYHVLSRISDAGLDYTQRTNKLAHHVAMEPRELTPAGPAALLSAPAFMTTSWSGEPAIRESGPVPPRVDIAPGICGEWGRLTGDPGWGGVIAEALVADARKQIVLVYRPGTNVLTLVAETLALLPANRRWDVTFCTYFTKLPPTVDCRWRCVVDGSPEAETLARSPTAIVVDLRKPLVPPAGSPYVSAARTGIPVPQADAPPFPIRSPGAITQPDQDDLLLASLGSTSADDSTNPPRRHDRRNPEPSHSAQVYGLAPPPLSHDAFRRNEAMRVGAIKRAPTRSLRPVVLLSIAMVGLLAIGGLGTYLYSIISATPREVAANTTLAAESQPGVSERAATIEAKPSATPLPSATSTATQFATPSAPPAATASENTKKPLQAAASSKAEPPIVADSAPKAPIPNLPKGTSLASDNPAEPDRRVEKPRHKTQAKENNYFPESAITSGSAPLGMVEPADGYTITIIFNDAVKGAQEPALSQSLKSGKSPEPSIVVSQPPQKGNTFASEPTPLAEISIPLAVVGSPAKYLQFSKRPQLNHNREAELILQTSVIEVQCTRKDGLPFVQQFQIRPESAQPIKFSALSDGTQTLPTFRSPKNSTLRLRTWLDVKGKSGDPVVVNKSEIANVDFALDEGFSLPLAIRLVDGANATYSIAQSIDYTELKRRDGILYESLASLVDKTPTINEPRLAFAETKLNADISAAESNQKALLKALDDLKKSKADTTKAEADLSSVKLLIQNTQLSLRRLRSLRARFKEINDRVTSLHYKLHVEILTAADKRSVVLLTTDADRYQ